MGVPLKNIVKNCRELEKSDQLKEFEKKNGTTFTKMVKNARIFSNLMVFSLRDMQVWNLLKNNKFKTTTSKFNLAECISEVYEMMLMKANLKSIKLESITNAKIPREVIGDKIRFQQVILNIVQNAISFTSEGKVQMSTFYNFLTQQVELKVTDTGIGIKPEEQSNVFKIVKSDEKIGIGLTISKQIAAKYNGDIKFKSEYKNGSTFEMNFDMEEYEPRENRDDFDQV